jgi:hypothetical protein
VRSACEDALWQKRITAKETALLLKRYEDALNAYTYLSSDTDSTPRPARLRSPRAPARSSERSGRSDS